MLSPESRLAQPIRQIRRAAAVAGSVLVSSLAPALAQAQEQQPEGQPYDTQSHLEMGSQDDTSVGALLRDETHGKTLAKRAVHYAKNMGATTQRYIVSLNKVHNADKKVKKESWKDYDFAIRQAEKRGLNVIVTLGCEGVKWTEQSYSEAVTSTVRHLVSQHSRITELGDCNEGNRDEWLQPLDGHTLPQTVGKLHRINTAIIKGKAPGIGTLFGELSSESSEGQPDVPEFLKQAMDCPPGMATCEPIEAKAAALHPYNLDGSPKSPGEEGNIGIQRLPVFETVLDDGKATDKIVFHNDTNDVQIELTEYNYWVDLNGTRDNKRFPHAARKRFLSDAVRRSYFRQELDPLCENPRVRLVLFYGILPLQKGEKSPWQTALVKDNQGTTTGSFRFLKRFSDTQSCVEKPGT